MVVVGPYAKTRQKALKMAGKLREKSDDLRNLAWEEANSMGLGKAHGYEGWADYWFDVACQMDSLTEHLDTVEDKLKESPPSPTSEKAGRYISSGM